MSGADPDRRPSPWRSGRFLVVAIPYLWLVVFFLVPFCVVLKISLSSSDIAQPPYTPVFDIGDGLLSSLSKLKELTLGSYERLVSHGIYAESLVSSLWIAACATLMMLVCGYPFAYAMARAPRRWRPALLMLVMLPFFTSFLIRIYAWIIILSPAGLLNTLLADAGLIGEPLTILSTNRAVYVGIVYCYLPFMVLPLYASLDRQDESLTEAAQDLGCTRAQAFWRITLPLSLPGILAGCLLVFIPVMGEFVIPDLLGGSDTQMIGKTMWDEFFDNRDWPTASALAIVILVFVIAPIAVFQNSRARLQDGQR